MRKCLINVEGGLGKNIMLTAILERVKTEGNYDELYVISPYNDVFKACPAVTDSFLPGASALYQELVLDPDCDVLWKEPYSNSQFIKKQCHLFDAWMEEFGFFQGYTSEPSQLVPDLSKLGKAFPAIAALASGKIEEWHHNFCIVQFTGGQSPLNPLTDQNGNQIPYQNAQESIKRNYCQGQGVINRLKEKYGPDTIIVHFALPNEPLFGGTIREEMPYLTYHLLAKEAKEIVCIDSSLQHLATGVCDNVTVLWGETRPEHFGYACNRNICAKDVLNSQPYFKPLGVSPSIVRWPAPEEIVTCPETTNPEEVTNE